MWLAVLGGMVLLAGTKAGTNYLMAKPKAEPWTVNMAVEVPEHCDDDSQHRKLAEVRPYPRPKLVPRTDEWVP